jgi:hypothetical protein
VKYVTPALAQLIVIIGKNGREQNVNAWVNAGTFGTVGLKPGDIVDVEGRFNRGRTVTEGPFTLKDCEFTAVK